MPFETVVAGTSVRGASSLRQPGMNLADAAEQILREHGEGRPMHYRTIAERAIDASSSHREV
jgi:hypothetical protein